jgi:hypothetical protein
MEGNIEKKILVRRRIVEEERRRGICGGSWGMETWLMGDG